MPGRARDRANRAGRLWAGLARWLAQQSADLRIQQRLEFLLQPVFQTYAELLQRLLDQFVGQLLNQQGGFAL